MNELERRLASPPEKAFDDQRLRASLAARAATDGLLDVAYATLDSPMGELLVAVTPRGLLRVAYPHEGWEPVLSDLAERVSPRILDAPERTDATRRELDAYFAGHLRAFDLPIDWSLVHGFATLVLEGHLAHFQNGPAGPGVAHQLGRTLIERFVEGWSNDDP